MPKVNLTPQAVLLTSGQAVTFEAKDESGNPVLVTWTLSPPAVGGLVLPLATQPGGAPPPTSSATYVAPTVNAAQTVAIVAIGPAPLPVAAGAVAGAAAPATTTEDSASATVSLTPDTLVVVPAKVELKPGDEQKFVALVAGAVPSVNPSAPDVMPTAVTWVLSPPIGTLLPDKTTRQETVYKAVEVRDSVTVNVIATSKTTGKQASAAVSLSAAPWTGRGVQLLGAYLLLVFSLVFLIVLLWPPALPSPDAAKANRIEAEKALGDAEKTLKEKTADLQKADADSRKAQAKLENAKAASVQKAPPSGGASSSKSDQSATTVNDAQAEYDAAYSVWDTADRAMKSANNDKEAAASDLEEKKKAEKNVNDPKVDTKLVGKINRELDLLWLVLLSGALGAFLHMSQSFSDYIGNRTIKSNWAWWYYLRPFIGAGLALVFYAALRGGVLAIATGANTTGSEINPFGLVSISTLVGMFSKAATTKLGEVFETLFKSDKATESRDKLVNPTQTSSGGTSTTGGSSATAK